VLSQISMIFRTSVSCPTAGTALVSGKGNGRRFLEVKYARLKEIFLLLRISQQTRSFVICFPKINRIAVFLSLSLPVGSFPMCFHTNILHAFDVSPTYLYSKRLVITKVSLLCYLFTC